jgi:DNA helicase-2/ATP-dependent DNA helicase PcrA
VVFVTGLEEGLLPYRPPGRPPAEEDEERRLLFVAFTRARERLVLTRARRRTLFGRTSRPAASPLLAGLPSGLLQEERPPVRRRRARQLSLFG